MAKKVNTALIPWEEELAREAQVAQAQEASTAGGQFFSIKGGVLSFNGSPLPGNQMAVIILDGVLENRYFEGKYDPDNVSSPACYAFGRDEKLMVPHANVVKAGTAQAKDCTSCPLNEWASADTGRGKACGNGRRLALIPAGELRGKEFELIKDPEHFKSAQVAYLRIPPTSVKGYGGFVNQVANTLRRPPHGIACKISLEPDNKTQVKVTFTPLETLPREIVQVVMTRNKEQMKATEFAYPVFDDAPAKPAARQSAPRQARAAKAPKQAKAAAPAAPAARSFGGPAPARRF